MNESDTSRYADSTVRYTDGHVFHFCVASDGEIFGYMERDDVKVSPVGFWRTKNPLDAANAALQYAKD